MRSSLLNTFALHDPWHHSPSVGIQTHRFPPRRTHLGCFQLRHPLPPASSTQSSDSPIPTALLQTAVFNTAGAKPSLLTRASLLHQDPSTPFERESMNVPAHQVHNTNSLCLTGPLKLKNSLQLWPLNVLDHPDIKPLEHAPPTMCISTYISAGGSNLNLIKHKHELLNKCIWVSWDFSLNL